MAKKKESADAEKPSAGQVSVITLKGSSEYREWLAAESERTHIPAASIVRLGLALWAEKNGAKTPPKK